MKKIFVMSLLAAAMVAAAKDYDYIIKHLAEREKAVAAAQAQLKDACTLEDYRALVKDVNGTNVWTAALQKALNEHQIVRLTRGEIYYFDDTVLVPSNRRIEATGATVRLLAPMKVLLLRNVHAKDGTLAPIDTTDRDENIAIVGGRWEDHNTRRKGYGGSGCFDLQRARGHFFGVSTMMYFGNVKGVTIKDATFYHVGSFAMQTGDIEDLIVENIFFDSCFADGLHSNGRTRNLVARNLRGEVGDDLVALNVYDWQNSSINFGPMDYVLVENLDQFVTSGYKAMRIEPGTYIYQDGSKVDCALNDAVIRHVKGIDTFKMYYQTPRYVLGKEPERGDVGSGRNIWFEDITLDLNRPVDRFPEYVKGDAVRGHFGAFEIGANISNMTFRDIKCQFHCDEFPLSHLVVVGPKSIRVTGAKGEQFEIFDPYVSCTVKGLKLEKIKPTGPAPQELVHVTTFNDINVDGHSSGKGKIED